MYRLYDYDVHSLIDESMDEGDIINTISVFMELPTSQRFLIIHDDEVTNTPDIRTIKNVRDYYNYILEYNEKLKQKSCMELKREILDINKRNKTRKK